MIPYNSITAIILITAASLAAVALHALSTFGGEAWRKKAIYINIALHALFVLPALLLTDPSGVPIELDVIALFYMTSLAVYTVCYFASDALEKRRERLSASPKREEAEDDL